MSHPSITMKDLYQKIGSLSSNEIILDVRSPDEFRSGHVPGSKNIPYELVTQHLDELRKYARIYIHCQAGGRAGKAASALLQHGLSNIVCISNSGMGDWIAAGFPVEK